MKRPICLLLCAGLVMLVTTHRCPAPIQEIPESPTPKPEQSAKPKPKRAVKPKTSDDSETSRRRQTAPASRSRATSSQLPCAGIWVGTTGVGVQGNVQFTIAVNADGSSATDNSAAFGTRTWPAKWDGTTLKWRSGMNGWTLTPSPDGRTAQVMISGALINNFAPTYRKQLSSAGTVESTAQAPNQPAIPTAKPVPGMPGYVFSPFNPNKYIDVEGYSSGDQVKDPYSGQLFIVP